LTLQPTAAELTDVRPLEPSDAPALASLFERLSPDSRWFRYLRPMRELPAPMLQRLAAVDHDRHEALGLFVDGELVGVAHWFRVAEDPGAADLAVEVADDHHRHGHGTVLLQQLGERAWAQGIERFTAIAATENRAVRAMLLHGPWPTSLSVQGPELSIELALSA
jgi:GNAT superfamily N-acetyltransferase